MGTCRCHRAGRGTRGQVLWWRDLSPPALWVFCSSVTARHPGAQPPPSAALGTSRLGRPLVPASRSQDVLVPLQLGDSRDLPEGLSVPLPHWHTGGGSSQPRGSEEEGSVLPHSLSPSRGRLPAVSHGPEVNQAGFVCLQGPAFSLAAAARDDSCPGSGGLIAGRGGEGKRIGVGGGREGGREGAAEGGAAAPLRLTSSPPPHHGRAGGPAPVSPAPPLAPGEPRCWGGRSGRLAGAGQRDVAALGGADGARRAGSAVEPGCSLLCLSFPGGRRFSVGTFRGCWVWASGVCSAAGGGGRSRSSCWCSRGAERDPLPVPQFPLGRLPPTALPAGVPGHGGGGLVGGSSSRGPHPAPPRPPGAP